MGGLHTLVIREHSSGSVASDMALHCIQYKHTKFEKKSCLGINAMTSASTIFVFWFSSTFCLESRFNFSQETEISF